MMIWERCWRNSRSALIEAWKKAIWIRNNTPAADKFLAPPTMDGFRVTAQRSHLGDWTDGTVGISNNGWALAWYDLMLELGFDPNDFRFDPLTTAHICDISARHIVDYAVVFKT